MSKVYLVGAGPYDPDLITVKGLKILSQADVVIYDYLIDRDILKNVREDAELICCDESLGRDSLNELMVEMARKGKKIVRLKNGDPFIFGRGAEEVEALVRNNIEFAVIPGVSAINAAACLTGIPLTKRGISSSLVITTGHEAIKKDGGYVNWDLISRFETIVLYMAVENLKDIAEMLIRNGKDRSTPVAVISDISKITQRLNIGTLGDIGEISKGIDPPAIVIIGELVKKEREFNWFKKTKKVLFTGISKERFFEEGMIFHIPMIEIRPLDDYTELDSLIKKIDPSSPFFAWIVFSSRFGVYYFFERLFKSKKDSRYLEGIKICAIGSSTANRLKEYGIIVDLVPKMECSYGLLDEFKRIDIKGKKILLLRSDIADKGLGLGLSKLGAEVFSCVAYRNVLPEDLPNLNLDLFDEIIFSSPSTVRNLIKRYGRVPEKVKIRTIGPVTEEEAKRWNLL